MDSTNLLVIEFDIKHAGIEGTRMIFAVDFRFFTQPEFKRHVGYTLLDERRHVFIVGWFGSIDFDTDRIGASGRLSARADSHSAGGSR